MFRCAMEVLMAEVFRMDKSRFRRTLATGLSLALMSWATSPAAKETKDDLQLKRAAASLIKRTNADSLAAAGLLSLSVNQQNALTLIVRATEAEPERADLAWLQAQVCGSITSCDPEPIERRLRELDPSNGAGWLGALARANSSNNDEARDAALAAIGHSERVDVYWTTLIARLSRATEQTKTMSLPETEVLVIGLLAAQAIPAYSTVSNACKGERLQRTEIVEICRGVAKALGRGDTYITEMIGVAIAKRVWPEESPEWKAATEARRAYEYRSKFWAALDVGDTSHADEFLTLCAQNRREQDVLLAQLIAAGKNPNPPSE
jgi:hypothetical protein